MIKKVRAYFTLLLQTVQRQDDRMIFLMRRLDAMQSTLANITHKLHSLDAISENIADINLNLSSLEMEMIFERGGYMEQGLDKQHDEETTFNNE